MFSLLCKCSWGCRHSRENEICPVIDHKCVTSISSERKKTKKITTPRAKNKRLASFIYIYSSSRASLAPYKSHKAKKNKTNKRVSSVFLMDQKRKLKLITLQWIHLPCCRLLLCKKQQTAYI